MPIFILSLIGILLFSPAHAQNPLHLSAKEKAWISDHPEPLRVHNEHAWEPYNYYEDGNAKGYSIDYMNLIAEKLGIPIKYISGPSWNEFMGMMKDGSLDLMINIASTKDRRTFLAFTEPYMITSSSLFVRDSEQGISDLSDMSGKRIGFTRGFFFGEFIRRYYPKIKIVEFDSSLDSFIGVRNGLADAAMEVPEVARSIMLKAGLSGLKRAGTVKDPLFITTFSIATRKDEPILRDIIQKGMDAISPAKIISLRAKWNLGKNYNPRITPQDIAYLERLGKLRICVNPDRLPLEAVNLDGSLTGISSEFVKMISQRLATPLRLVKTRNWAESMAFVKAGRCDLLPMVIKSKAGEHYGLDFTLPWLSLRYVVATRSNQVYISDFKQIIDRKIGIVRGLGTRSILQDAYPGIKLDEVGSVGEGLAKVKSGELFGFVDAAPAIAHAIQKGKLVEVKISGEVGINMDLSIGLAKGNGKLLSIVERSIASIDKQQITAIYNRWLAVAYVERVDYTPFWQLLIGITLVSIYLCYRYRRGMKTATELRLVHARIEAANRELDKKNQELAKQARTDSLTGLSNRLNTDEALHEELKRFERYKVVFSVVMLDIDYFKKINDDYGHAVGDRVLKSVAGMLKLNTRENDLVGRWGGEEFMVVCPSTTLEGARRLAEILKSSFKEPVIEDLPPIAASFGVASIKPGEAVFDLVRRADDALYVSKNKGRNRVSTAE